MRAEHHITLYTPGGSTLQGTCKRPSLKLTNALGKLQVKTSMLTEQRTALFLATREINSEMALSSLAPEAIANDTNKDDIAKANQRLAEATEAQAVIQEKIDGIDEHISDCLIEQLQLIVNVPKGDADKVPDIDWEETDLDDIRETLRFFATGKKP